MAFFGLLRRSRPGSGPDADVTAEQLTAARTALDHCRQLTQHYRRGFRTAIAGIVVVIAAALYINRGPLIQGATDVAIMLRLAAPATGVDAAYAAYRGRDGETALQLAHPLAEQGDVRALTLIGLIYLNGVGVARDESEAAKWLRRAADRDDATAQLNLGLMYSEGRGVPQNFMEAEKWFLSAAAQSLPQAQYNLGIMYANGNGVLQDNVKAHMWFNLAAANFPASQSADRELAARNRNAIARKMTAEELTEAQRLARAWKPN